MGEHVLSGRLDPVQLLAQILKLGIVFGHSLRLTGLLRHKLKKKEPAVIPKWGAWYSSLTCLARVKFVDANFFTLSKFTLIDSRLVRVSVAEAEE